MFKNFVYGKFLMQTSSENSQNNFATEELTEMAIVKVA